jgi:uncharacterized protein involved in outer membrane biogenesis
VLFDHALPDTEEVPFSLASRVLGADGAVDLKGFELHAEGGELKLDSHISLVKDLVGSRLSLSGHGLNLAHLIPSFPGYEPSQQPWKIGGTFSIPSTGHVEIRDGNVQVGSIQIEASGVMDVREQEQTDLALTVSGTTLNDIGQIAHLNWPDIPFSVNAALDGTTDAINISRFDARLGTSDLTATGALELAGKPRIALHGTSSLLKIDEIQQAFPDQPATSDGGPKRFIPDTPLPLLLLASQDVDLTVKTARFEARRLKLDDVDLAVKIQDGALELDRLRYRDQDAYFDASGSLRPTAGAGMAQLVLKVTGKDADLGLFTSPDQARETVPKYNLDIAIDGTGSTLAELAGNLNGSILVWSDGGQINNNVVQTFASDFLVNVLDTLNPFTQSEPFTPLQCMVLNGIIESGKMNLQPGFVMRTNRLNMFVVGDVNLRTEKLNLSLATQARQGIGISAATLTNPYFKIGGTLSAPQLQLDAQSATIAASVTAATAGLSIVVRGVWSRLMGEQNPCPQFLNYERKSAQSATGNRQQK